MIFESNKFLDELTSGINFSFFSLKKAQELFNFELSSLPFSYRLLLENLIRKSNSSLDNKSEIINLIQMKHGSEIFFSPSRVLMQDYTGVPAIADLASMRDKMAKKRRNPELINPLVPVSLVVDHSISVDSSSKDDSLEINVHKEFLRNSERYSLLKWAQKSLKNFSLFPPGSGICHQINIEYLTEIVSKKKNILYLDSVVGTDSHTTMVNALSVLGWGVGGIEAEAVMLGQPISMKIPEVVGVMLEGNLKEGVTATDVVLTITEKLRKINVVGKFVEFFGAGLSSLSLSERSTISNMAPEYGATCGLFPMDDETLKYLRLTGREEEKIKIIESYCKTQFLWHDKESKKIKYSENLKLDLSKIEACVSGPKRPQDRIILKDIPKTYLSSLDNNEKKSIVNNKSLTNGKICLAAITSCTNTSNPIVLLMSGLIAKKAVELGLKVPWWVKTSFAPGSKVVREYLNNAGLQIFLNKIGFNIVGYGCTTCIGNSGPLDNKVSKEIEKNNLNVCSIISGNRNFEGRIHPQIKSNFLASPPLVVIYALSGRINIDFDHEEIGIAKGKKIFLKDLWPSSKEVKLLSEKILKVELFKKNYKNIFKGDSSWEAIKIKSSSTFNWSINSTYIKKPPFLENELSKKDEIFEARPLLILGDSITTDHISPAGVIKEKSEAGKYLSERQIKHNDFNSFGSRRGNHEVMVRGTFSNLRIKNLMVDRQGGFTKHYPSEVEDEVYNIAEMYSNQKVPLIVVAGKEYGTGSSRDWAAKGTKLLGVRVVLAESFERIHRSNLVGMGVLPLEMNNTSLNDLKLNGDETFNIGDLSEISSKPNQKLKIKIKYPNSIKEISVTTRIDTEKEVDYFKNDGILPYVFNLIKD
ncbi:MAG: aconitate hydratase AcnA [Candidatus Pelagibacter sp.]|nr:aconitate hydratase AcnA [Candidatus Pelagibacter sp.]|tara:strand:+ start:6076 stop:8682 length:2607 start_codon:yes stop_codon:yes gene_type:complete